MNRFQVSREGQNLGEFAISELEAGVSEGYLLPTDYCWQEGMNEWAPLEAILSKNKAGQKRKGIWRLAMAALVLALGACIGLEIQIKLSEAELGRLSAEKAEGERLAQQITLVKAKLARCDRFLSGFEIVGKGSPDPFDKNAPISPGEFRDRTAISSSDFNEVSLRRGDGVPRFELFTYVKGDGEIQAYVRSATKEKISPNKYDYSGLGVTGRISFDGNAEEIRVHARDDDDARQSQKVYISSFELSTGFITKLAGMLRANQQPKVMIRIHNTTADLTYQKAGLLRCVELAEVLEQRNNLVSELKRLEGSLAVHQDAASPRSAKVR